MRVIGNSALRGPAGGPLHASPTGVASPAWGAGSVVLSPLDVFFVLGIGVGPGMAGAVDMVVVWEAESCFGAIMLVPACSCRLIEYILAIDVRRAAK